MAAGCCLEIAKDEKNTEVKVRDVDVRTIGSLAAATKHITLRHLRQNLIVKQAVTTRLFGPNQYEIEQTKMTKLTVAIVSKDPNYQKEAYI